VEALEEERFGSGAEPSEINVSIRVVFAAKCKTKGNLKFKCLSASEENLLMIYFLYF
jgi:hypothetical protein